MESKFQVSVRDAIYFVTLVLTIAGMWFSTQTRMRELELKFEGKSALDAITIKVLEGRVSELEAVSKAASQKRSR